MNSLLIMAGGASSRMKRSLEEISITADLKKQALQVHKSLIPLGAAQKPLLFYLIKNAVAAGHRNIYLITSPENQAFKSQLEDWNTNNIFTEIQFRFAIQQVPQGRVKPLGTADAIQQTLDQHPELKTSTFFCLQWG